jgi:predicted RNA-binding Zn-ribbon protein involved in translation (DUF1610 family)
MKVRFKRKYRPWTSINVCTECDKSITDHFKFFNYGVCPHCGNKASLVCSTYPVVIRRVTFHHVNWWVFISRFTWIGKTPKDNDWLIRHNSKLYK